MRYLNFILAILILSCTTATDKATKPVSSIEGIGNYMIEHSKNTISVKDDWVLRMSGAVISPEEVGSEVDPSTYAIQPKVKGKAYWKDMSTLVFSPDTPLKYNQNYTFTLRLSALFDGVPDNLKKIQIPFQTRPISFEFDHLDNVSYSEDVGSEMVLQGSITTNDYVESTYFESILEASQSNNNSVTISWDHSENGLYHRFEIYGIKRLEKPSEIILKWKDNLYESGFAGQRIIPIYPKNAFEFVAAEVDKDNQRKIILSFTSAIKRSQTLDGLIRLQDYKGDYTFEIIGSRINVYPQKRIEGPFVIEVNKSIVNQEGKTLSQSYTRTLSFDPLKPSIRLVGKGVIVPYSDEVIFPFEAVNLKSAVVEVVKIFSNNVIQFLQYNQLNTTYNLEPVGRIIHQEKIKLSDINPEKNDAAYTRYALDLSKMIRTDPGALYQVRIGFSKEDVDNYPCSSEPPAPSTSTTDNGFSTIMQYPYGYRWSEREDPCSVSYYASEKFVQRNVLGSNIGIIAKKNRNHSFKMILSDLQTIQPIAQATVTFYDFQQQEIAKSTSGSDGILSIELDQSPAFAIVIANGDFGYINLQDPYANSMSEFNVSGSKKKDGLDGYIYGERGVWRPGDTLYLTFVLEDLNRSLPDNHPVVMTVKDARGKEKYSRTATLHNDRMYSFPVPTSESDPTGNWTATVTVGGVVFQKNLKVETVKPNRLKIQFDIDPTSSIFINKNQSIQLESKWLHGAPASGLSAKVDLQLQPVKTRFQGYGSYNFDDPARRADPLPTTIFEGKLTENGTKDISLKSTREWEAPGQLKANFKTKVFENGGNFSEDNFSIKADLYDSYVGVAIPQSRWGSNFIEQEVATDIPIVVLDPSGEPIANRNLSIGLYQAEWNWWYDRGYSRRYNYNSSQHNGAVQKSTIKTNQDGKAAYSVLFEQYGNYMIRICDEVSGHCTGDLFYTGYAWSRSQNQEGPQQLTFKTDKESYFTDDNINVKIPSNQGSKILISIETGEKVLETFWVDGDKEETSVNIKATKEMNPNVYIHAQLIQPHNNGENDLPIRMYGVVPVSVVDKNTQIEPILSMPEAIRPNQSFEVKVSEKLGKPMSYTLAVVDEGLLDLTRFQTPELWNHFYAKQALGVNTWDIYDYVLDGYGGMLDKLISIGGDGDIGTTAKGKKANRFEPVAKYLGPFTLNVGEEHVHEIEMPNYVGSVRTMVVARNHNAYGSVEETTPVKKPLMALATLPRVLGPGETVALPANIFAMEEKIKNVKVSVETSEQLQISAPSLKELSFEKPGDKTMYFDMNVGNTLGMATVKIRAQGHGEGAFDEVNIAVRNPNPTTSKVLEASIEPGETWKTDYALFGTEGSNEGVIELSSLPPMNFEQRLKYLVQYPYGCIEQTTSSIFPQLYLNAVTEVDDKTKYRIENNVKKGIERLSFFQTRNGGLSYWPGDNEVSEWGSNYAMHFLLEAKEKGYYVPQNLLNDLIVFQDNASEMTQLPTEFKNENAWKINTQAYRLYTLAKAGRPNIGAMNLLRNYDGMTTASAHMLAASYALIGKKDIAKKLVSNQSIDIKPYVETGRTYGSHVRDMAMMAEALQIIGNDTDHAQLIKQLAQFMRSDSWYSTQTTAYALLSLGKFMSKYEQDIMKVDIAVNGNAPQSLQTAKPILQKSIEVEETTNKNLSVKNTSNSIVFARLVLHGQLPPNTEEEPYNNHIKLNVRYTDQKGKTIDPTILQQGTDFKAVVTVQNMGSRANQIEEVALAQIFPSGWEIQNDRLSSLESDAQNSSYEYRDYKDDRVYTFFDLNGTRPVTYTVNLTATYAGKFYLPPVSVEAMYDRGIQAKSKGSWVEVIQKN